MEYCYSQIVYYIGLITVTYFLFHLAKMIYHFCRVYFFPTYPNFSQYGKWSVITGSTDGIGKSIAFQLASRGQNIVLIARNNEKLEKVSQEITSTHGVLVKHLKIDFTDEDTIYGKIALFLKDLDIGVLINNVGISVQAKGLLGLAATDSIKFRDITRVNMFSMFKMSEIVVPGMVERRRGLVVNISSISAIWPFSSVYGATKSFADYFSRALNFELTGTGVTVQSCLPGIVSTNMTKNFTAARYLFQESDSYALSLLATVDKEARTFGCWQHALQAWMIERMPSSLFVWFLTSLRSGTKKKSS